MKRRPARVGLWAIPLLALLACESEPEKPKTAAQLADDAARDLWKQPVDPATPAPAAPDPQAVDPTAPEPAAPPAPALASIPITYEGINTLYKSFFGDPALQSQLLAGLAGAVGGAPELSVRYDELAVRGHIRLKVPPGGLTLPVRADGDRVMVQDLVPIMVALDTYRVGLGARYDLRLLNFRVGIELRGGGRTCLFGPAGDPPPDGSVVSPCVDVGGQRECGAPGPNGVLFEPAVAAAIRACLGR